MTEHHWQPLMILSGVWKVPFSWCTTTVSICDTNLVLWVWIYTLQGPFLDIFATELGERNVNKSGSCLKGIVCTVISVQLKNFIYPTRGSFTVHVK